MLTFRDKLESALAEGVAAQARGTVINVVNSLASRLANVATRVFNSDQRLALLLAQPQPEITFADDEDEPATITLLFGRSRPQALTLKIYGDGAGEIKLGLAQQLAYLLQLPHLITLNSEEEAASELGQIAATMSERLTQTLRL